MSEEQLRAFLSRIATDNDLQQRLQASDADVVAIALEAGFVITQAWI
jgi:predicted ribosomally synthesized peptide with nif11-like leader